MSESISMEAKDQMEHLLEKGIYIYRGEVKKLYGNMFLKLDNLLYENHGKNYYSNYVTENLPQGQYVKNLDQSWTLPFKVQLKHEGDSWISFNNCQINVTQGKVYLHDPDIDVEIAIEPDIHFDFDFKLNEENKELLKIEWLDELSSEDRKGKWLDLLNNYKLGNIERFFMNPLLLKYCIPVAMFGSAKPDMGKSTYMDLQIRTFGAMTIHFLNDDFMADDIENLNHCVICCGNEVPISVINKGSSFKEIFDPDRNIGGVMNTKGSAKTILNNHATLVLFSNDRYPFKGESYFKRILAIILTQKLRGAEPSFSSLTEKDFQNYAIFCVNGVLTVMNSKEAWDEMWDAYEASVNDTRKHVSSNITWDEFYPNWIDKCVFDVDEIELESDKYSEATSELLKDIENIDTPEFCFNKESLIAECVKDFDEFTSYEAEVPKTGKTNFWKYYSNIYFDKTTTKRNGMNIFKQYRVLPKQLRNRSF